MGGGGLLKQILSGPWEWSRYASDDQHTDDAYSSVYQFPIQVLEVTDKKSMVGTIKSKQNTRYYAGTCLPGVVVCERNNVQRCALVFTADGLQYPVIDQQVVNQYLKTMRKSLTIIKAQKSVIHNSQMSSGLSLSYGSGCYTIV